MTLPDPFIPDTKNIHAIIETPKGSRNKYVFDEVTHFFKLKKALPAGMVFPFDFGFIPSTIAEDGDPMDILVLTDAPTHPGCLVECQVLGILMVEQKTNGKTVRNDRVVAVQLNSRLYSSANHLNELPDGLVKEIVNFFAAYKKLQDEHFTYLGNDGPNAAIDLIQQAITARK